MHFLRIHWDSKFVRNYWMPWLFEKKQEKSLSEQDIHLIPKWRLSQMIWVELHENEASRAKRRCLQMHL